MVEDFLLSKALTTSSVKNPTSLVKPLLGPREWIAEGIYIVRPLIYGQIPRFLVWLRLSGILPVLLLSSDRERKSGRPLMVSLALELLSRNLRRTPSNSSALERQEYARRDRDLFWYLFRGSIWESWTRYDVSLTPSRLYDAEVRFRSPKLESLAEASEKWPILNILGPLVRDWMPLVDEYYYCESELHSPSYLTHLLVQIHLRSLGLCSCAIWNTESCSIQNRGCSSDPCLYFDYASVSSPNTAPYQRCCPDALTMCLSRLFIASLKLWEGYFPLRPGANLTATKKLPTSCDTPTTGTTVVREQEHLEAGS
jgi:hypothetical protein